MYLDVYVVVKKLNSGKNYFNLFDSQFPLSSNPNEG